MRCRANGAAALNLVELARITGEGRWLDLAGRTLDVFSDLASAAPDGMKTLLLAARRYRQLRDGLPSATGAVEGAKDPGSRASVAASQARGNHRVQGDVTLAAPGADGWRTFRLALEIEAGWHLYAHGAKGEFVLPTAVDGDGVELRGVSYPAGEARRLGSLDETIELYDGRIEIAGELRVAAGRGGEGDAPPPGLRVRFQACSDALCGPPGELLLPLDSPV